MSTNPPPVAPVLPAAVRSSRPTRHALGLPAGSVRSMLALAVIGLLALIVFLPGDKEKEVPTLYIYLWAMSFLIIAHFFASHGKNIGVPGVHTSSPLGLPRGSVRFLLLLGLGGIVAWLYHTQRLYSDDLTMQVSMLAVIPIGFFVGYVIALVVRTLSPGHVEPYWFQDVEAWVALVSMLLLLVIALVHLFVNYNLPDKLQINTTMLEGTMAAMVSFYFGARS